MQSNQATVNFDQLARRFEIAIGQLIDSQEKPFVFARSNRNNLSSNVASDVYIFAGPAVPYNYKGIVKDFNINFSTVAGTIKICVLDEQNTILYDISTGITSSSSGFGSTVLNEGEKIGIMGQSAGAGTFGCNITGVLKKQ